MATRSVNGLLTSVDSLFTTQQERDEVSLKKIYDIPISLIFTQYMEYVEQLQKLDMDVAGEFLEMASRLMLIKSRMLLPRFDFNAL